MRIGRARTTGPNAVSPHVYIFIERFKIVEILLLHTRATAFELSKDVLSMTVK